VPIKYKAVYINAFSGDAGVNGEYAAADEPVRPSHWQHYIQFLLQGYRLVHAICFACRASQLGKSLSSPPSPSSPKRATLPLIFILRTGPNLCKLVAIILLCSAGSAGGEEKPPGYTTAQPSGGQEQGKKGWGGGGGAARSRGMPPTTRRINCWPGRTDSASRSLGGVYRFRAC